MARIPGKIDCPAAEAGATLSCFRLFEAAPAGFFLLDVDGRILAANHAAEAILGRPAAAMRGLGIADPAWQLLGEDGSRLPAGEHPALVCLRTRRPARDMRVGVYNPERAAIRWLRINAAPVFGPGEEAPRHVYALFDDVTEIRRATVRDFWHREVLEGVASGAPLGTILDILARGVENEDASLSCSILLADAVGRHALTAAAPSLPAAYNRGLEALPLAGGSTSWIAAAFSGAPMVVADMSTDPRWQKTPDLARLSGRHACWSLPIRSSQGAVLGVVAIYRHEAGAPGPAENECLEGAARLASIAVEHSRSRAELERQARTDYLTGLDNRRAFWERAESELARALRYGSELSLLMIDVDRFKRINDRCGHNSGDRVLRSLADTCRRVLREVDASGRLGGEEFGILLPATPGPQAQEVAERLREAFAADAVRLDDGRVVRYTVSIGLTTLANQRLDLDGLFGQADRALYAAKAQGRDRVCAYATTHPAGLP